MGEVCEKDGENAVKQVKRYRRPCCQHRQESKALPDDKIDGMMASPRRHVDMGITVMNHVQSPQGFHVVQTPMHTILGNEVKNHDGGDDLHPKGRLKQMKQSNFMGRRPSKHPHGCGPKCRIDRHRRGEEGQIGSGVLPRPESPLEHRPNPLNHEVERHACHNPDKLLPRGHGFEKVEERFHAWEDTCAAGLWANLQAWKAL